MKILKHGDSEKVKYPTNTITFKCERCGCVFEAKLGEYRPVRAAVTGEIIGHGTFCPECDGFISARMEKNE